MVPRVTCVILYAVSSAMLLISACAKTGIIAGNEKENESIEGWINDETYRVAAGGIPLQGLTAIDQKKESSRQEAILNARCQIIEHFTGFKTKREMLTDAAELEGIPVRDELKTIVKTGIVKKTVWDHDGNCEIIFEVKHPDLKKNIDDGYWK